MYLEFKRICFWWPVDRLSCSNSLYYNDKYYYCLIDLYFIGMSDFWYRKLHCLYVLSVNINRYENIKQYTILQAILGRIAWFFEYTNVNIPSMWLCLFIYDLRLFEEIQVLACHGIINIISLKWKDRKPAWFVRRRLPYCES